MDLVPGRRTAPRTLLKRWSDVVVRPILSETDLRTLYEWGRFLGVSRGTLRNWCHTARISARRSLLFARLLRAVARRDASTGQLEDLLNVVDGRTISKLLTLAGSTGRDLPSSVPLFLESQRLIKSEPAIKEVVLSLTHYGVVQAMKQSRSCMVEQARPLGRTGQGSPRSSTV